MRGVARFTRIPGGIRVNARVSACELLVPYGDESTTDMGSVSDIGGFDHFFLRREAKFRFR